MSTTAYNRKKQPELVRRSILKEAQRLALAEGMGGVTIQAIATAVGVTKGGVFHHFPSKQALVEAMFDELIASLDAQIDRHLEQDSGFGCFTRAYVETLLLDKEFGVGSAFDALSVAVVTDRALGEGWTRWLARRLERHRLTDGDPMLEIVRFACDGAWLSYFDRKPGEELKALRTRLVEMTGSKKAYEL